MKAKDPDNPFSNEELEAESVQSQESSIRPQVIEASRSELSEPDCKHYCQLPGITNPSSSLAVTFALLRASSMSVCIAELENPQMHIIMAVSVMYRIRWL